MSRQDLQEITLRTFEEAFNKGDVAIFDETVGELGMDHQHPNQPSFRDHLKDVVAAMRRAFPDLRFAINQIIDDGEWVALHSYMTGTHKGELGGPLLPPGRLPMPATGRAVRVAHMHMIRYQDGRGVELWHQMDTLGMLGQLGLLPAPAPVAR